MHTTPSIRPEPKSRQLLCALAALLLISCSGSSRPHETIVLLDTSGSTPSQAFLRSAKSATAEAAAWSANASPRDVFTLAWLGEEGSPYPIDYRSWSLPKLEVPANRHRALIAERITADVESIATDLPTGIQQTKLLEALCYLASIQSSSDWTIVAYSDFVQDSDEFNRAKLDFGDDTTLLVAEMLRICPPAEHPPKAITLIAYPGRISRSKDIHYYQRSKESFALFASRWSDSTEVKVKGLR